MKIKTVRLKSDWGDVACVAHVVQGLPDGVSCSWSPEEVRRPRGEAFVVKRRRGRKMVRRFKTAAEAEKHAKEWAAGILAATPPTVETRGERT